MTRFKLRNSTEDSEDCLGEDGGRVWTSDAGTRVRQVVVHRLSAVSAGEQRPGQD